MLGCDLNAWAEAACTIQADSEVTHQNVEVAHCEFQARQRCAQCETKCGGGRELAAVGSWRHSGGRGNYPSTQTIENTKCR